MWEYVEADFRRDYNIRLSKDLLHMTWREFDTLLHGLSPWGSLATNYDRLLKEQKQEEAKKANVPDANTVSFWNAVASFRPNTN